MKNKSWTADESFIIQLILKEISVDLAGTGVEMNLDHRGLLMRQRSQSSNTHEHKGIAHHPQTRRWTPIVLSIALSSSSILYQNCTNGEETAGNYVVPKPTTLNNGYTGNPPPTGSPTPPATPSQPPSASAPTISGAALISNNSPTQFSTYDSTPHVLTYTFTNKSSVKITSQSYGIMAEPTRDITDIFSCNSTNCLVSFNLGTGLAFGYLGGHTIEVKNSDNVVAKKTWVSQCISGSTQCRFYEVKNPKRPRISGVKIAKAGANDQCQPYSHSYFRNLGHSFTLEQSPNGDPNAFTSLCLYFGFHDPNESLGLAPNSGVKTTCNWGSTTVPCNGVIAWGARPNNSNAGTATFRVSDAANSNSSDSIDYVWKCDAVNENGNQNCTLKPVKETTVTID